MNTARKLLVIAALLSVSACASHGMAQNVRSEGMTDDDAAYIATVENLADHNVTRMRVIWINPPSTAHVEQ
jgi:hypothetical protein